MSYDNLILATGSSPNKFGWPGQDLKGVTGMVSLQDLETIETYTKNIRRGVVVGGGLIGIELAEMLRSRNIDVTFLIREPYFWSGVLPQQEGEMISSHIKEHHVDLRVNTELKQINGDESGRVTSITTSEGEEIKCEFVGLTVGVHANIGLAEGTGIETNRGFLVNEYLETSVPGIYAIGDCAELREHVPGRRAIEQVWYVGRMMGEVVAQTIAGTQTVYRPGPWFNSAKFFDIEYQTYGNVCSNLPEEEQAFFWKAENKDIAVHITFKKDDHRFTGINTFGIRMRHRHFDKWLSEEVNVSAVLENLEEANFDPEFFRDYSKEIRMSFAKQYPEISLQVKPRRKKILGIF
jgi:NADPH-dependent 2,4-dienoyl-CoA reductase/sulfur reductase-like enzyme